MTSYDAKLVDRDGTVKPTSIWLAGDIPNGKSLVAARWAAVQNGSIPRTEDVFEGSVFCPNQIGKGGARYSDNTDGALAVASAGDDRRGVGFAQSATQVPLLALSDLPKTGSKGNRQGRQQ